MSELVPFNLALGIHHYTHPIVFVVACLIITGILFYLNKKRVSAIFFASFILTSITVVILKYSLAVPRPSNALIEAGTYAFPSSHSALSIFLVTTVTWLLVKETKLPKKAVWVISTLLLISSIIIGLSRLTLQVHTPMQVVAGFILGIIIPAAFIFITENKLNKTKLQSD